MLSNIVRFFGRVWQNVRTYNYEFLVNIPINAIQFLYGNSLNDSRRNTRRTAGGSCPRRQIPIKPPNEFKIHIVTWNVCSKIPPCCDRLLNLLNIEKDSEKDNPSHPDFYAIGLQELSGRLQKLSGVVECDESWCNTFIDILSKYNYVLVKGRQMFELAVLFFAKRNLLPFLRKVDTDHTRTGFGGLLGNKGALSIRVNINGCAVCLVNSHLTADENAMDERINDYQTVLQNHHYEIPLFRDILSHDIIFWFGDLNFRLKTNESAEEINRLIQENERNILLAMDELKMLMDQRRIFIDFIENFPKFPPTYKFEIESIYYDLNRRPAWTDRILYRTKQKSYSNKGFEVHQILYSSYPECDVSDHRPVAGEYKMKFIDIEDQPTTSKGLRKSDSMESSQQTEDRRMLPAFKDDTQSFIEFGYISEWLIDEDNAIVYTLPASYFENPGSDWIAMYRSDFTDLSKSVAYEYVPRYTTVYNSMDVRRRRLTLNFAESAANINVNEKYVLLYFERIEGGAMGVIGISNAFSVRK